MNAHTKIIPANIDGIEDELDRKARLFVEHKRTMEDILREQSERPKLRPAPRKSERWGAQ